MCPNCETKLKVPDEKAGLKITCPECQEKVPVPAEDVEDQPRAKAKKGGSAGAPKGVLIGVAAAACLLVAGGGIYLFTSGKSTGKDAKPADAGSSNDSQAAKTTPPADSGSIIPAVAASSTTPVAGLPGAATPPAATKPDAAKPATPATKPPDNGALAKANPGDSTVIAGPLAEEVSKRLMRSTAWIVTLMNNGTISGSGSLVDRENKLILTNYHVISMAHKGKLRVFFPEKEKGKIVQEVNWYLKKVRRGDGIPCRVVHFDKKRDLALVQLVDIPEGVQVLPIAKASVAAGQMVHSMGSPGASGALFVYTQGTCRAVYQKKWMVRGEGKDDPDLYFDAQVMESSAPTNSGDSGGPVVNDRKELVAVTQGGVVGIGVNLISTSIDVTEVRKVLKDCYEANKSLKPPQGGINAPIDENRDIITVAKGLKDSDPIKRARTAELLGRYGAEGRTVVPMLVKALKDSDDDVRKNAAESLQQIGNLTQSNLPDLKDALKDKSVDVRLAVIGVLKIMGQEAESAVPVLIDVLKDRDKKVRQHAAQTLGELGATAKAAIPTLGGLLKDESPDVRVAAAAALSKMGTDATPALKAIADGFKDDNQDVRVYLLETVKNIGPDAKDLLPEVMKALKKERDDKTRLAAIGALGSFGSDAASAVPELVDLLEFRPLQQDIMEALVKIGPKPSVPALVRKLGHPKKEIRLVVVQTLEKFGGDAKPALPTLNQRYRVEIDPDVKKAIEKLFRKLRA